MYSHWDCVDICFWPWVISTSGLGYCFYFRFACNAVVRSPAMSTPAEMDWACPKTLLLPLRSRWYRFPSQSYDYFRYIRPLSWSFWVKEAPGEVGMYIIENLALQNIGCVDICFRCWVISTSGLALCFYFRFVPYVVLRSRTTSVPVEVDRACLKTVSCRSRLHHVYLFSSLPVTNL